MTHRWVQNGSRRLLRYSGRTSVVALLAKVPSLQWIGDIDAAVDHLVNAGLLVRSEGGAQSMSFRHSVFREIAYASLLRSTRRDLHGEIATVLIDEGVGCEQNRISPPII